MTWFLYSSFFGMVWTSLSCRALPTGAVGIFKNIFFTHFSLINISSIINKVYQFFQFVGFMNFLRLQKHDSNGFKYFAMSNYFCFISDICYEPLFYYEEHLSKLLASFISTSQEIHFYYHKPSKLKKSFPHFNWIFHFSKKNLNRFLFETSNIVESPRKG